MSAADRITDNDIRYVIDPKVVAMLRDMPSMSTPLDVYTRMADLQNTQFDDCVGTWTYNTFLDILGKAPRFNSLTEKQAALVIKLAKELDNHHVVKAQRDAEYAAAEECPKGRFTISGKIVKTKWHENGYGSVFKILVKDIRGFIVYLTGRPDMAVGGEYVGTVTLTPSDKDPKFGFGKRPTNVGYKAPELKVVV